MSTLAPLIAALVIPLGAVGMIAVGPAAMLAAWIILAAAVVIGTAR